MRNFITTLFIISTVYILTIHQIIYMSATPANGNSESQSNRARYHSRSSAKYRRIKPDTIFNDFGDDDDIFDVSKRQQLPSEDYGHLRFGKRGERLSDDYGHMRFGRDGGDI